MSQQNAAPQAGKERRYCCYGCRFAASVAAADGDEGQARWAMTRLGVAIVFSMGVMVFTMLLWSQPVEIDSFSAAWYDAARYACLLFTVPVLLLLGGPLAEDAVSELGHGQPSLSLLLVTGIAAAFGYSLVSLLSGGGHVYFEVACTILVATTLGRWLEAEARLKTTAALRGLERLLPDMVRVVGDVSGRAESDRTESDRTESDHAHERLVPAADVRPGDVLRILPGERIAADGVVARLSAAVDEQAITGESLSVVKRRGDRVSSGTLVLDGPLEVEAVAEVGAGTVAQMIDAVSQATSSRTRYGRLVDVISRWFLAVIACVALATFAAHLALGSGEEGLLAALAVVVIACPCALGLATPMAIWAAIGRAAQSGVVIRDGDALPLLAKARTVCFDKTGTLTTGQARAVELVVDRLSHRFEVLRIAHALARGSTHPLAVAVAQLNDDARDDTSPADRAGFSSKPATFDGDVLTVPGCGLRGEVDGIEGPVQLGSRDWLLAAGSECPAELAESPAEFAETCVAWQGRIRGVFRIHEELRAEAAAAIRDLQRDGLQTLLLTGDRQPRARAIAQELGIEAHSELAPQGKLAMIAELRGGGPVVMVGDGINDAPALASADVGVSLGSGTDIARHSAGVCLLANDLSRLPWLIELARATAKTIRWNLFWAFAYNVAGIGLAALGIVHPVVAAIAMTASGLLVVTNSLALARFPAEATGRGATVIDRRQPTAATAPRSMSLAAEARP